MAKVPLSDAFERVWPYAVVIVGATFWFGYYVGKLESNDKIYILESEYRGIKVKLDSVKDSLKIANPAENSTAVNVLTNGNLNPGFGMGVASSDGNTSWVTKVGNALVMTYPSRPTWGSVYITVGNPAPVGSRPSKDFSIYRKLIIELKGNIGNEVSIGLKSNTDTDYGSETKYPVHIFHNGWNAYTINLKEFTSADLHRLYVVTEFVFEAQPETISVRKIQFIQ